MSQADAMSSMYSSGINTLDPSLINKPLKVSNILRGADMAATFTAGPLAILTRAFILQPLKYALYDYMGDRMNRQTPGVVHDPYTESILVEAMSYQLPQSKPELAPKITGPKKTYSYKPKLAGICRRDYTYDKKSRMCVKKK